MAGGSFGGGDGSVASPYLIEDALDLDAIRNITTNGLYFKQTQNIDMSVDFPSSWVPLMSGSVAGTFNARYNGDGYSIKNLKHSLFNNLVLYQDGLKNIFIEDIDINLTISSVGGLARSTITVQTLAITAPTIINCHVTGSIITTGGQVGGLIGHYRNIFSTGAAVNSRSFIALCSVDATIQGGTDVGGIIGRFMDATNTSGNRFCGLRDCKTKGSIVGTNYVGGIIGVMNGGGISATPTYVGYVLRCISESLLSGTDYVAGIVGGRRISQGCRLNIEQSVALMTSITRSSGAGINFGRVSSLPPRVELVLSNNRALDTMMFIA